MRLYPGYVIFDWQILLICETLNIPTESFDALVRNLCCCSDLSLVSCLHQILKKNVLGNPNNLKHVYNVHKIRYLFVLCLEQISSLKVTNVFVCLSVSVCGCIFMLLCVTISSMAFGQIKIRQFIS